MNIKFTPVNRGELVSGEVIGETLVLNGEAFDLAPLGDGATLPATALCSRWVADAIERRAGVLYVTLFCPHGPNAPHETRFPPDDYILVDGVIPFPPYDAELDHTLEVVES